MKNHGSKRNRRDIIRFATLTGLLTFVPISTDLYLPAIPMMTAELGSTISQSQLTLSLFMLGVACGQVIFGPLSDQFGRLPVIRLGTLTFVGFSLLSSLAWNIEYMWLARVAQGAAAASGAVISRALIRDRYEGNRAAQMMALTGAAMASVPLVAPSLGAYITVEFGWRFTFVAQSLFAVLVYLGLSSLQTKPSRPTSDIKTKLTLGDIAVSFKDCLSNPKFLGYQVAGTLSFCGLFIYLSTVSFFLTDVFRVPTQFFGLAFAMTVVGFVIGSLLSSRLVMKWGQDKTLHRGTFVCVLTNSAVLLLTLYLPSSTVGFAILSILFFFGIGLISANASMGAVSLYPHKAGAASAVYGCIHSLSSATMGAIAGLLYAGRLLEPVSLMLLCSVGALFGSALIHRSRHHAI
ncbi:MAG: Bcr/CflA family efflux MFS transporter [Gammaproteobacteria bacterium]|nr:Bcr/CflA family efflux MFS transporter [Gammaproteobacteria bacterium]